MTNLVKTKRTQNMVGKFRIKLKRKFIYLRVFSRKKLNSEYNAQREEVTSKIEKEIIILVIERITG